MSERLGPLRPFSDLGLFIYNSVPGALTLGALGSIDAAAWQELQNKTLRKDEYNLIRYEIVTRVQELAMKYVSGRSQATQLEKVRDRILNHSFRDNEEARNDIRKIFTDRIRKLNWGDGPSDT